MCGNMKHILIVEETITKPGSCLHTFWWATSRTEHIKSIFNVSNKQTTANTITSVSNHKMCECSGWIRPISAWGSRLLMIQKIHTFTFLRGFKNKTFLWRKKKKKTDDASHHHFDCFFVLRKEKWKCVDKRIKSADPCFISVWGCSSCRWNFNHAAL